MTTALLLDCEVNSFANCEPIEVAILPVTFDTDGKLTRLAETVSRRFMPTGPISAGALLVHGILIEELEGLPASSSAIEWVAEVAKEHDAGTVIGHNVDFDCDAIGSKKVKRVCTLAMARVLFTRVESHKLGALAYEMFGFNAETRSRIQGLHAAKADVDLLYDVLEVLCARCMVKSVDALQLASDRARIPTHMRNGKHKGELIERLPFKYLDWFLKQDDVEPFLLKAITKAHGKKEQAYKRRAAEAEANKQQQPDLPQRSVSKAK